MTAEYAPETIERFFAHLDDAAPELGLELAGILGNTAHTYGYHRSRNWCARYSTWTPRPDYSIRREDDRAGDGNAASAVDLTPRGSSSLSSAAAMIRLTTRVIRAIDERDPRARYIAEVYGTVNGRSVTGRLYGSPATADDSHVWHLHLAARRRYADDPAAWRAIESILLDQPIEVPEDDPHWSDTVTKQEILDLVRGEILDAERAVLLGGDHGAFTRAGHERLIRDEGNGVLDRLADVEAKIAKA